MDKNGEVKYHNFLRERHLVVMKINQVKGVEAGCDWLPSPVYFVYHSFARLEILAALLLRIQAFWDVVQDIWKDLSAFIFKVRRVSELAWPLKMKARLKQWAPHTHRPCPRRLKSCTALLHVCLSAVLLTTVNWLLGLRKMTEKQWLLQLGVWQTRLCPSFDVTV